MLFFGMTKRRIADRSWCLLTSTTPRVDAHQNRPLSAEYTQGACIFVVFGPGRPISKKGSGRDVVTLPRFRPNPDFGSDFRHLLERVYRRQSVYERIHHLKFKPISFETELLGNPPFFE